MTLDKDKDKTSTVAVGTKPSPAKQTPEEHTSQEHTSQEHTSQEHTSQEHTSQEHTSQEHTSQEHTSASVNCVESNESSSEIENGDTSIQKPRAISTKTTTSVPDNASHNVVGLNSKKPEISPSSNITVNADTKPTKTTTSAPECCSHHNNIDEAKETKSDIKSVISDSKVIAAETTSKSPPECNIVPNNVSGAITKKCDLVKSSEKPVCSDALPVSVDKPVRKPDTIDIRHTDNTNTKSKDNVVECQESTVSCDKRNTPSSVKCFADNDKNRTDKTAAQVEQVASKTDGQSKEADSGKRRPENDVKKAPQTKTTDVNVTADETKTVHSKEKQKGGTSETFKVMRNIAGQIITPSSNIPEKR